MAVTTTTYAVTGMTCEHCVMAVTGEVADVRGVTAVAVELAAGTITVTGEGVSVDAIAAAIDEAGYELVP